MNKEPFVVLMAEDDERTINLFWELVELPGGDYGPS